MPLVARIVSSLYTALLCTNHVHNGYFQHNCGPLVLAMTSENREQARIILKQNPPVVGKQLAQQRAAAMREAVQEDEDALATGAQSRSAVAALAPGSSRQSSLWARAISGLAADAQPKRRPSIAQRLSRPEEESSEALPGAGVADDGVRSPRKRSRSDAAAADAEGQDQETVRSEKVKHKKHKHRRE